MKSISSIGLPGAIFSVLVGGCGGEGKSLSAERTGDLSYPVERGRPDAEHIAGCGDGAVTETGATAFTRRPYLQQVTARSAQVVFRASAANVTVDVSLPDGTPVTSVEAASDASAPNEGGNWQGVAALEGLEASTLYCYTLRGLTRATGFRTAPAAGSGEVVRFIAFGDSGDGSFEQYAVRDQMYGVPFDLVLHTGDLAYESGSVPELTHRFFTPYEDLLSEFAVFPVAGNHEHATGDGLPFREAFVLPENGAPDGAESWYSFDWGDVHFVGLDTEKTGPAQAAWLDRDLAASELPWKIVFAHKPPFSSGEHGPDPGFLDYFMPVIQKRGVALVLNGHDHHYERTRPIAGTTYVVTGGGGKGTRQAEAKGFTAFAEDALHFVQVEIAPDALTLHAIDGTGVEFDSARLPRAATGS